MENNYLSEMISGIILTTVPDCECDNFLRTSISATIDKYQMRKVIQPYSFYDDVTLNIYSK